MWLAGLVPRCKNSTVDLAEPGLRKGCKRKPSFLLAAEAIEEMCLSQQRSCSKVTPTKLKVLLFSKVWSLMVMVITLGVGTLLMRYIAKLSFRVYMHDFMGTLIVKTTQKYSELF